MFRQRLLQQVFAEDFVNVLGHFVLLAFAAVVFKGQNNRIVGGDPGAIFDGMNYVLIKYKIAVKIHNRIALKFRELFSPKSSDIFKMQLSLLKGLLKTFLLVLVENVND
jgi:hypothetical protein